MATFTKFQPFVEHLAKGVCNLATDTCKVMLTNTVPVVTNDVYADISGTELANGNGYTTGGTAATESGCAQAAGVLKLTLGQVVFTCSGSPMGPFRYAVLYDSTPVSKPMIGWFDYLAAVTLQVGETFTVALDQAAGTLTLA